MVGYETGPKRLPSAKWIASSSATGALVSVSDSRCWVQLVALHDPLASYQLEVAYSGITWT